MNRLIIRLIDGFVLIAIFQPFHGFLLVSLAELSETSKKQSVVCQGGFYPLTVADPEGGDRNVHSL